MMEFVIVLALWATCLIAERTDRRTVSRTRASDRTGNRATRYARTGVR